MLYGKSGVPFVCNFKLSDFRGWWSATPKNRGQSKKSGGGSLAVGSYLQRGSAPPPPSPSWGLPYGESSSKADQDRKCTSRVSFVCIWHCLQVHSRQEIYGFRPLNSG